VISGVELYQGAAREWDGFVRAAPHWTHFHLLGWRTVVERVFRHECLYLAARDGGGRLRGVLPLVRVKSLLFGHYLVSLPFVNYGGPLGEPDAVRRLGQQATEMARAQKAKLLELRSRTELPLDLPVSHRKITVLLDVPSKNPDELWRKLPAKVRSQVRRPLKEGVEVKFGLDQVAPFYDVFARHMRDLGTPVQSRRLFETIAQVFPDDTWFGCAYLGRRAVAGGCGFRWCGEFEMTWASALTEYNPVAPNMLLYWRFMSRCAEEGVDVFNFGRCTPDSGTHRFKRQWGSRDEPLWWYYAAAGRRASTPSPDDGAYAWGPRMRRHVPLCVANVVGPAVVRNVP